MCNHSRKVYLLLALTAILWGGNPIAVKCVLGDISPLTTVMIRFLGISIILLALAFWQNGKKALPRRHQFLSLFAMGFTGIVMNSGLQFEGLRFSTAVNCTLISAMNPTLTACLAALFLREKMEPRQWLGVMVSFMGVVLLVSRGSVKTLASLSLNRGDVLFLGAQLGWALYSILGRKVMRDLSPIATTAWAGVTGTVLISFCVLYDGFVFNPHMGTASWLALVYMIAGSGVLAFCWWNKGVAALGPNKVAIFSNVIPMAGMLLSAVFLHEAIGWKELMGSVWIIGGVLLTSGQLPLFQKKWYQEGYSTRN